MTSRIHILLPVHNRCDVTRRFILCLQQQTCEEFSLILLDDGSTDGTSDMVQGELGSRVEVIRGDGTWWWAGALQKGYDVLRERSLPSDDLVAIMNDDTEFAPDFLATAQRLLSRQPRSMLLSHCYSRQSGDLLDAGICIDWRRFRFLQADLDHPANCFSTRGLILHLDVFLALGGFRPKLLPHYASDYEFTIRAQRSGLKLLSDPALRLDVDEHQSGYREIEGVTVADRFRNLLSPKHTRNPLTWLMFVILACPSWPWKIVNVFRVFRMTIVDITYSFRRNVVTGNGMQS